MLEIFVGLIEFDLPTKQFNFLAFWLGKLEAMRLIRAMIKS
jgi:hypothetical protein